VLNAVENTETTILQRPNEKTCRQLTRTKYREHPVPLFTSFPTSVSL